MQDPTSNNHQAANSEYERDGGAGNQNVDFGDQHQQYSTGYRGGRGRGRGRGRARSFFTDNWRHDDAGGAAGHDEDGGYRGGRGGGRGGRGGGRGGRHYPHHHDDGDGEDGQGQRHYDPDEEHGYGRGGRGRGRTGRYQDRAYSGGYDEPTEDGGADEEGGFRGGRGFNNRGGRGGGYRNNWRNDDGHGDNEGDHPPHGYRGGRGRGGYRNDRPSHDAVEPQGAPQSGNAVEAEAQAGLPGAASAMPDAAPVAASRSLEPTTAASPAATPAASGGSNAWASRRAMNATNATVEGENTQSQRYGEGGNYGNRAPAASTGRTQRPPHLRSNCRNEEEVLALFTHHHKQKGVSLDNYSDIPVELVPNDVEPVTGFTGLKTEPALAENIARCGYENPTPVQRYGIPVVLEGNDLMACAQTGSGKTAAFLIPVVNYILKHGVSPAKQRVALPIGLVLAPTRELALQIYDEVRKLTFRTDIFYDVCYGGTPYPTRFDNDILVACPGRLKDIFDRGTVSFRNTRFLILDEADRMLEMGFEEQIEYLVASRYSDMPVSEERQTLMFSATFPQRILNLAKRYLRKRYYLLTVGRVGSTTKNITQTIENVQDADKMDRLFELIFEHKKTDLVLIFVETKRLADDLYRELRNEGIPSSTIHGDRRQQDREAALAEFKSREKPILVATDVASRGLDIPDVTHVIQYDLPQEMDDYTHRIGRTGRAGNKGVATSFYNTRSNSRLCIDLYKYLREHEQEIPQWFKNEAERLEGESLLARESGGGRGGRRGGGGPRGGARREPLPEDNSTWGQRSGGGRAGGATASRGGRAQAFAAKQEAKTAAAFVMDDGGF